MKPTNNGNCKNGDSGHYHHYWRCKKSALHTGWLIFRSRFFKQNHRKNISEFWVVFPQFFFICTARAAWKTEEKWLNSTPPWNEFCGVDNTHSMNPNTRKSLEKKRFRLAASVIILEFFDLFTHFGNHTGSQRKKLHFPCQSLSFYYPLI